MAPDAGLRKSHCLLALGISAVLLSILAQSGPTNDLMATHNFGVRSVRPMVVRSALPLCGMRAAGILPPPRHSAIAGWGRNGVDLKLRGRATEESKDLGAEAGSNNDANVDDDADIREALDMEWNDDLEEFIGDKPPDVDEEQMKTIMQLLEEKGGFQGELEKTITSEMGVNILQNRKFRKCLLKEDGTMRPDFERALDAVFDAYDFDQDDGLSFSEMSAIWAKTSPEPMTQEFWIDVTEYVQSNKNGLTRDGWKEFMTMQATIDSAETLRDLRALGFEDQFPEPVVKDENLESLIDAPPAPVELSPEFQKFLEERNISASEILDMQSVPDEDEYGDTTFLDGEDEDYLEKTLPEPNQVPLTPEQLEKWDSSKGPWLGGEDGTGPPASGAEEEEQ